MMDDNNLTLMPNDDDAEFYKQVADLLVTSRKYAKQQMDNIIVTTYFAVGHMIVEREQQGQKRAQYGAKLIKGLSEYLTEQYGRGFSVENLQNMRKFYQVYMPSIQQSLSTKSDAIEKGYSMTSVSDNTERKQQSLITKSDNKGKRYSLISLFDVMNKGQSLSAQFNLTWTHYQVLMRVKTDEARRFYEIEAES